MLACSAISSKVASLSQWFDNVSCESGDDGSLLTNEVLANSKKILNKIEFSKSDQFYATANF